MAGRTARERAEREARRRAGAYSVRRAVHERRIRRRRRDDVIAAVVLVAVLVLATLSQVGYFLAGPGRPAPAPSSSRTPSAAPTPTPSSTVPPAALSEDRTWSGTMTVNGVKLSISLDGKRAPQAVANFVSLARSGYWTGAYCPRIAVKTVHILQCGTKTDSAADAGPGYSFGPIENAPKNQRYATGVLAMARVGGDASSQGSQFFIVTGPASTFPNDAAGGYTVFGRVTSGLDALNERVVAKGVATAAEASGDGQPKDPIAIGTVAVR